ncbi:hypothetical protein FQN51_004260 [Onygenales sp. PD_10]|nr:hypothetical protein FQN51_004260 [Onygenales sp. PD_10]
MGKPRMIILIRHAQSEGNKNREIHQSIPDHRVKLTPDGQKQALEAGRRLHSLLRPDDTLHFFTSPYRRTRETTEGILTSLTSDNPSPSPFPRHTIKVYEEPRLREQDFGNFQPCSAEMERMWQERADYGHFFYRIPNGESAADAYDRISGFNESLWRLFGEDDFASVCILVTHGLMTRIFLMKWYHFSVEYFEDLRNVNHCEFVVMKKKEDNGKYVLQNKLRTWSELKRERELEREREAAAQKEAGIVNASPMPDESPIPIRRKWGGCPDGCNHSLVKYWKRKPQRQATKEFAEDEGTVDAKNTQPIDMAIKAKPATTLEIAIERANNSVRQDYISPSFTSSSSPDGTPSHISLNLPPDATSQPQSEDERDGKQPRPATAFQNINDLPSRGIGILHLGGRDGGGSQSGTTSRITSDNDETDNFGDDDENYNFNTPSRHHANSRQRRQIRDHLLPKEHRGGRGVANTLGDRDDDDNNSRDPGQWGPLQNNTNDEKAVTAGTDDAPAEDELEQEEDALDRAKSQDQSIRGSVY